MSTDIAVLANGVRVVTDVMAHLETTSLGLWVGVGARDEKEAENGISHLIEHMAFKGTTSRSAQAIAEEIEAVGGELNAATGLEQTAYFARVLKGDEGVALDLIADILNAPRLDPSDLAREREVILQEIAATRDNPEDIAYDLIHEAAFPDQAVGRSILGTPQSLKGLAPDHLRAFLASHYHPQNIVISAAGAVEPQAFVRHAEALFGGLTGSQTGAGPRARYQGGVRWQTKPFEQAHVLLAWEAPSYRDGSYFAAQVFSGLFGGGMSSRLFQEARERRGLCYAIYSSATGLMDTGLFNVHAATGTETMAELIAVVRGELLAMAEHGPSEAEIDRAKAQLKAGLHMALESSSARAEQMARHLHIHGRLIGARELIGHVDSVTRGDVQVMAARFAANRPATTVVGAGRRSKDLAILAHDNAACAPSAMI